MKDEKNQDIFKNKVILDIVELARTRLQANRVILFGSRARGRNDPATDFDLAFDFPTEQLSEWSRFVLDIDENIETLKNIDCINYAEASNQLKHKIDKEGLVVYDRFDGPKTKT